MRVNNPGYVGGFVHYPIGNMVFGSESIFLAKKPNRK